MRRITNNRTTSPRLETGLQIFTRVLESTQVQELKSETDTPTTGPEGLLNYNDRLFIPRQTALNAEILRANHDDPQGGHFGIKRTDDIIRNKYFWHGMTKDIKQHCTTCNLCQRVKARRHKPYGELETP